MAVVCRQEFFALKVLQDGEIIVVVYIIKKEGCSCCENGHLRFSIFNKNKKTTESVIFRLYFKDIDIVNVIGLTMSLK